MLDSIYYSSFAIITAVLGISYFLYPAFKPSLYDIPGPRLAKLTDLWRTWHAYKGTLYIVLQELKEKHGNVIRIGPNTVLVSEQGEYQKIMGFKQDFVKSDSMLPWQAVVNGKVMESLGNTSSKTIHAKLKRPIAGLYANSNVIAYQPRVEDTIRYFLKRLDQEFIQGANAGRACDIDNWVQYFAFDILGQLTFSRRLGFLEQGHDVDHMLADLDKEFKYRGVVQNLPWLDNWLKKNPLYLALKAPSSNFVGRAKTLIGARLQDEKHDGHDMMDGFLEAQQKFPETVTPAVLAVYVTTNLLAGSDTTAVSMRSVIYYVLKTPGVLQKVRDEVDAKIATEYPPSYKTAMDLTYIDACIREALRMHAIGSFLLERVVPETGYQLSSGKKFLPGTVLAMTPWTLNFDEEMWGKEPHEFRPERWLQETGESDSNFQTRLAMMKYHDTSFSYGPRACLGKHIAWMEMVEVLPTLFGLLDIEFVEPEKPWRVVGGFFIRQFDMDVRMKWRKGVDRSKYVD